MKPRRLAWAFAAFALAAFFAQLGQWQLGRARDKEALTAAVRAADRAAPLDLGAGMAPGSDRPVRVAAEGSFDPEQELLLDNQTDAGRAGVRVLTLFHVAASGARLLVDRGWLPIDPVTRVPATVAAPPAGTLAIGGLLTALPGVGVRMGDASIDTTAGRPLVNYLDQTALHDALGPNLVAGLLRLDASLPGGFLRNYQPVPDAMPPDRHRGYALQWFALAATVLVTWLLLAFRRS